MAGGKKSEKSDGEKILAEESGNITNHINNGNDGLTNAKQNDAVLASANNKKVLTKSKKKGANSEEAVVSAVGEKFNNVVSEDLASNNGDQSLAENVNDGRGFIEDKKLSSASNKMALKSLNKTIKEKLKGASKLSAKEKKEKKESVRSKYNNGEFVVREEDEIASNSENCEPLGYAVENHNSGVDDFMFTEKESDFMTVIRYGIGKEFGNRLDDFCHTTDYYLENFGEKGAKIAEKNFHPARFLEPHGRPPRKNKVINIPITLDDKNCPLFGSIVDKEIELKRIDILLEENNLDESKKEELNAKILPLSQQIINDIINMEPVVRKQFKLYLEEYLNMPEGSELKEAFGKFAAGKLYLITKPVSKSKVMVGLKAETVYALLEKYYPTFMRSLKVFNRLVKNLTDEDGAPINEVADYALKQLADYPTEMMYEVASKFNALSETERERFYRIANMNKVKGKVKRQAVEDLLYKLEILGPSEDWRKVLS